MKLNVFAYEGGDRQRKVPYAGMGALLDEEKLWADSGSYLAENVTPEAPAAPVQPAAPAESVRPQQRSLSPLSVRHGPCSLSRKAQRLPYSAPWAKA